MSSCDGSPAEQNVERYLKGTLPELRARSFEEHYLECRTCLAEVEALEAVTLKLAVEPAPRVRELRPRTPVLWPYYVAEAVAAVLVLGLIALGVLHLMRRQARTSAASNTSAELRGVMEKHTEASALEAMADTSLPPFVASHARGSGGNADFATAVRAYKKHDCAAVVPLLTRVPREDGDYPAARLYSGLCELNLKQWVQATDTLKSVAYMGESPQQEAAFYYLAQAELARDYGSDAEQDLVRTVVLHGNFEGRASAELDQLRSGSTH